MTVVLTEESKRKILDGLIASCEAQESVYRKLAIQPGERHKKLVYTSQLNQKQLELLIKYKSERFG